MNTQGGKVITKIISGGQTGADQGGLEAGRRLGIFTGGTAPHGWLTERGPQRELLQGYGLVEGEYDPQKYPLRTAKNVKDSDGTALFGSPGSPGSRLTINICKHLEKPYIINPTPAGLLKWIKLNSIEVLNVAGNRESRNPGIQRKTRAMLVWTLDE